VSRILRTLVTAAFALCVIVAGGKVVLATAICPPLCILPPDPPPPMPPMPVDDPPLRALAPTTPSTNGTHHATPVPASAVTITNKKQAGGECKSGNVSGTLVLTNGKYSCNFMPSTLQVGAACHANSQLGTVTVVDGKRYCKIQQ
jgi:hypothetical protein